MSASPAPISLKIALPHPQPENINTRLLLFGIRQIGAHGLNDAATAHAFITAFGQGFRRPLLLLRTLMMEISAAASAPIQIAPWCCGRMTAAENALVETVCTANQDHRRAALLLSDLLGQRRVEGVLATARTLSAAFADAGMPIEKHG